MKAALEKWVVGGLLLVFLVVVVRSPLKQHLGFLNRQPVPSPAPAASTPAPRASDHVSVAPPETGYTATDLRDPLQSLISLTPPLALGVTTPSVVATPSLSATPPAPSREERRPPPFTVQGVVVGMKPQAIINGDVYSPGDVLAEGVRVQMITREGVLVSMESGRQSVFYPVSGGGRAGAAVARQRQQ